MAFLNNLKSKIQNNNITDDVIGEIFEDVQDVPSTKEKQATKENRKVKRKEEEISFPLPTFNKKEVDRQKEEVKSTQSIKSLDIPVLEEIKFDVQADKTYGFLQVLGVDRTLSFDGLLSESDVDNVTFTKTAPVGLEIKEVQAFCDRVMAAIIDYKALITRKQEDLEKIIEALSRSYTENNNLKHQMELGSIYQMTQNNENRLRDEITELKIENSTLKQQITTLLNELKDLKNTKDIKKEATQEKSQERVVVKGEIKSGLPCLDDLEI